MLQYCNGTQIARLAFYEAMVHTLHHKMNADEVYDGFFGRAATPKKMNRDLMRADNGCGAEASDSGTRIQKLKQTVVTVDHEHRDGWTN